MRTSRRVLVTFAAIMIMQVGLVAEATQDDGISWGSAPVGTHANTTGITWG